MLAATATQHPRYEAHEDPPFLVALGYGLQFSLIASATLLVTPVIVAQASGRGDSYLVWMVFASLVVVGVSTLLQVRRLGTVGAGAVLPMFTAAFSIPFCITAVVDGGPATLTTLVLVTAVTQLAISKWLFILRRIVTPNGGWHGNDDPVHHAGFRRVRAVGPGSGGRAGSSAADGAGDLGRRRRAHPARLGGIAAVGAGDRDCRGLRRGRGVLGVYDIEPMLRAPWVGLPSEWPGLGLDFGLPFWTLLPAFLFLGRDYLHSDEWRRHCHAAGLLASGSGGGLSTGAGSAGRLRCDQSAGRYCRGGAEHHQSGHRFIHADHWRRVAQSRLLHRWHVHRHGVSAQGIRAPQHHPRAGHDGLPDPGDRNAVR